MLSPALMARRNSGITFRPDANCVLWLPGQDDPQSLAIRDRSGYANNGVVTAALWKQTVAGLWYLKFDGTDDVVTIPANAYTMPDAFTVELWFRMATWADDFFLGWNVAQGQPALGITSSKYYLYMGANNIRAFVPTGYNSNNTWYHIAYVMAGAAQANIDTGLCYVNGNSLAVFSTDNTGAQRAKDACLIGNRATYNDFTGDIALFRMHNVVRSAEVIASHYQEERHLFGA